jgi:branched-chain amino acid transport system substrate-binding protein
MRRATRLSAATAVGMVALLIAAWGVPAGAANTASAPGITAKTITIGFIASTEGVAGPNFVNYGKGVQARFDQQNAAGGVNGRKLQFVSEDDGGSPTADVTIVQSLLSKGAFGLIIGTPFFFEAYKAPTEAGIPVVGGGYDGTEWGLKPDYNMFSTTGDSAPTYNVINTGAVDLIKDLGGNCVAGLGYGISPSSSAAATAYVKSAAAVGLKNCYVNTTIPFGGVNVEPVILAMKQAGVNAVGLEMDNNTNFAVLTAAQQSGLKFKAAISATGYGQSLLADPSALTAARLPGSIFIAEGPPLSTAPEKAFRAALKKYEGFSGIPGFDWYEGYTQADLMIKGLEVAGKNPTRQSFITNLRKVKGYTANGLLPNPIDLSMKDFGKAPATECSWYAKVKGNTFVPVPASGKPVCGKTLSS